MTFELSTVLTIVSMIVVMIVFYFVQMSGFEKRLGGMKEELIEDISKLQVRLAEHGIRLEMVEKFTRDINHRVTTHVNGGATKHKERE